MRGVPAQYIFLLITVPQFAQLIRTHVKVLHEKVLLCMFSTVLGEEMNIVFDTIDACSVNHYYNSYSLIHRKLVNL